MGNPIVEIRRSYDRLISTMGFPILNWIGLHLFNDDTRPSGHISRPKFLVRWHLYIESGPRVLLTITVSLVGPIQTVVISIALPAARYTAPIGARELRTATRGIHCKKQIIAVSINSSCAPFFLRIHRIYLFHIISWQWNIAGCLKFSPKEDKNIFTLYTVNIMDADVLATQGARASAPMVLTKFAGRRCSNYIFNSRLKTWLQWIGQRQLQDETRNIKALGFGALILEVWWHVDLLTLFYNFPSYSIWSKHCTCSVIRQLYDKEIWTQILYCLAAPWTSFLHTLH